MHVEEKIQEFSKNSWFTTRGEMVKYQGLLNEFLLAKTVYRNSLQDCGNGIPDFPLIATNDENKNKNEGAFSI